MRKKSKKYIGGLTMKDKDFLRVEDVQEILQVKENTAYAVIRKLNKQLKEKGFETLRVRVNKKYFFEKYNLA